MDDDAQLDEIRRRKMAELQAQAQQEQVHAAQREQVAAERDALMRVLLEPDARERLARVRMARPDIAESLENQLFTLYQQGRVRGKIDDATLRQLLARVTPKSRETTIERR